MKRAPIVTTYQENQEILEDLVMRTNELMDMKKGVLGLDESDLAFDFLFSLVSQNNDWENRRLFRQFLVMAPLEKHFAAMLLSEEFVIQSDDEAIEFIDILKSRGLPLGVRLDKGTSSVYGTNGEYIGSGENGMFARADMYKQRGCIYSKWRSIFQIKDNCPTLYGTEKIATKLAKFAATSQASGLVPIVSIEVVPDGAEDIYKARTVLEKILINVIKALNDLDVLLEATIFQVSFVQPGRKNKSPLLPYDIAEQTLEAFKRSLPVALGGLMFHSSGLSEEIATQTLNHIILIKREHKALLPWKMIHAFGRAQKVSAIMTWEGDQEREEAGHEELIKRAIANNEALLGEYEGGTVQGSHSDKDLYIPNYVS